jgi:hypothetical protein
MIAPRRNRGGDFLGEELGVRRVIKERLWDLSLSPAGKLGYHLVPGDSISGSDPEGVRCIGLRDLLRVLLLVAAEASGPRDADSGKGGAQAVLHVRSELA